MDAKWMQRVCLHALCIPAPDSADYEAWDAVSPTVASDASDAASVVLRATRDLEAGEEITLDYGARSNAELLTTHGFTLLHNRKDAVPITLTPTRDDAHAALKQRILAAGNLTGPLQLSPMALREDSDLLVALRVLVATPTELKRYADAFRGSPLSDRNEQKWRQLLQTQVEALLAQHERETSADDDRARLTTAWAGRHGGSGTLAGRRWIAALICRMGEKNLLRATLSELKRARYVMAHDGTRKR